MQAGWGQRKQVGGKYVGWRQVSRLEARSPPSNLRPGAPHNLQAVSGGGGGGGGSGGGGGGGGSSGGGRG